ncbi:MAG TPA: hypothetical protein VGS12_05420 [Caulobacteraceae bacterium]|nr:hypothetical protein [Caulobacteraceae bacterium]
MTITDTAGLLSASAAAAGSVAGSGTAKVVIRGQLAQVNGDLATLAYERAAAGSDVITLTANDGDGGVAAKKTIAVTTATSASILFFGHSIAGLGAGGATTALVTSGTDQRAALAGAVVHGRYGALGQPSQF